MLGSQPMFVSAKPDGETWIEHSKRVYHCGRALWELYSDKISNFFTKEEYLFTCFYHDIGKLLKKDTHDTHTPYTKQAFDVLKSNGTYDKLNALFGIPDISSSEKIVRIIKEHHDKKTPGSEWIVLADSIASIKHGKLRENIQPSAWLTLSMCRGSEALHIYDLSFRRAVKNYRATFGLIFLSKILRESIYEICNGKSTFYLYDVPWGCRVLSTKSSDELMAKIYKAFENNFNSFFEGEGFDVNFLKFIGGQPQSFYRMRELLTPAAGNSVNRILYKAMLVDILIQIKDCKKTKGELESYTLGELEELIKEFTNLNYPDLELIESYNCKWIGYANEVVKAFKSTAEDVITFKPKTIAKTKPLYDLIINEAIEGIVGKYILREEVGINTDIKNIPEVVNGVGRFFVRKNSYNEPKTSFLDVDKLREFIAINDSIPIDIYAIEDEDTCSCCGTFKQISEMGSVSAGFSKQQWRESLGQLASPQVACELCRVCLALYSLKGPTERGQNIRPLESIYLTVTGLALKKAMSEFVESDQYGQKKLVVNSTEMPWFRISDVFYYVPKVAEYETAVITLRPLTHRDSRKDMSRYPSMQEYYVYDFIKRISDELGKRGSLVGGFSVKDEPSFAGPELVLTPSGYKNLDEMQNILNIFRYVSEIAFTVKEIISTLHMFKASPAYALSSLYKEKRISKEKLIEGVKFVKQDEKYEITHGLWEIVNILACMPTGPKKTDVMKPVKRFRGTPESLDLTMNYLMKNSGVGKERRAEASKKALELRNILEKLTPDEQRELREYVKKTTFFFKELIWNKL